MEIVIDPVYVYLMSEFIIGITILVVLGVSAIIFATVVRSKVKDTWPIGAAVLCGLVGFVAGFPTIMSAPAAVSTEVQYRQVLALNHAGFLDVQLVGNKFTADRHGQFFKGSLEKISDNHYEVLQSVPIDVDWNDNDDNQ